MQPFTGILLTISPEPIKILNTHKQLLRYAVVGVGSNVILYLVYLLLTSLGLGHKTAMTLLYTVGILQTFLLNRRWTFDDRSAIHGTFSRYIITYALGYLFNLGLLYILVDEVGLPHQIVQGVLIFVVAVFLFLLQKYWVFSDAQKEDPDYGT